MGKRRNGQVAEVQIQTIEDGFGTEWTLCKRTDRPCGLEVVRPGKVQCWCDHEDADGNCIHSLQEWSRGRHTCQGCGEVLQEVWDV